MGTTVQANMKYSLSLATILCSGSAWLGTAHVQAQPPFPESPYYQPLNQNTPPGVAGQWAGALRRADPFCFQPVRVSLPGGGQVTFLDTARGQQQTLASPAQAGLLVGPLYRLVISDMPEFPGVMLYPTVELIDRLHRANTDGVDGVIFNPGGYTHTSVALRDAVASISVDVVEVHISNVHKREAFRHHSYVSGRADAVIAGCGTQGYLLALQRVATLIG